MESIELALKVEVKELQVNQIETLSLVGVTTVVRELAMLKIGFKFTA